MPVIDLDAPARQTQLSVDDALAASKEFGRGQQLQLLLVSSSCRPVVTERMNSPHSRPARLRVRPGAARAGRAVGTT